MSGHEAPPSLAAAITAADAEGRALVTTIGGRVAILLPPVEGETDAELTDRLQAIAEAVQGI